METLKDIRARGDLASLDHSTLQLVTQGSWTLAAVTMAAHPSVRYMLKTTPYSFCCSPYPQKTFFLTREGQHVAAIPEGTVPDSSEAIPGISDEDFGSALRAFGEGSLHRRPLG